MNTFGSRSGVTSNLFDLICELRPSRLTGRIVRALHRASVPPPDASRAGADPRMFAELHLLHTLCSHTIYFAHFTQPSPSLLFTPKTGLAPFFTNTKIKLLEGACDAEGKASSD